MNKDNDDPEERARVYSKLAPLIMAFARANAGRLFTTDQLLHYVRQYLPNIAPASPDRILRMLKQQGRLYYACIDRRRARYQFRDLRNWRKEDDDAPGLD
jgi:hypothetical protein